MNNQKKYFAEKEYKSFVVGVLILGGLVILPLFWGYVFNLRSIDSKNYYPGILPVSLLLSAGLLVAFRRDGSISSGRMIITGLIGLLVATILAAASGRTNFLSNTVISFLVTFFCGYFGIVVRRLFKDKHDYYRKNKRFISGDDLDNA